MKGVVLADQFLPGQDIPQENTGHRDIVVSLLLYLPLISVLFLQKFAISVGSSQIPVPLIFLSLSILFGILTQALFLEIKRTIFFFCIISLLGFFIIINGKTNSLLSFVLLIAVNLPYVFRLDPKRVLPGQHLVVFRNASGIIALCGIGQFVLQLVGAGSIAFPIETYFPYSFIQHGYNNFNPLYYGSHIYKSNGVFLYEASLFSQLMAISIVVEFVHFKNMIRLFLLFLALVVSYSGTGIVDLAICLFVLILFYRRWDIAVILGVLVIVLVFAAGVLHPELILRRVGEFSNPQTSGFARFVGQFPFFDQFLWPDVEGSLIGMGSGSTEAYAARASLPVVEMSFTKIVFEYGVIGATFYFMFLAYCYFVSSKEHIVIRLALFISFFLNSAFTPWGGGLAATLLLWGKFGPPEELPAVEAGTLAPADVRASG